MNDNQVKAKREKMEWIEPTFEVLMDPEKAVATIESTFFSSSGPS